MPDAGHNDTGQEMSSFRRQILLRGLLPLLVIGLVLGGYGVYWQQVATRLQAGVEQWASEQRAGGATIDFQWHGITGFPFAFTANFTGVNILGRLGGTALSARTDHLQLNMSPVDLNAVRLLCDQPLTVIVPGVGLGQDTAGGGADLPGARIVLDQADGLLRLRDGNPAGATIDANRAKLDNGPEVLSVASLHLDVQLPANPPSDFHDPAATLDISVSGVDMPVGMPQLLPGPIAEANLTGVIMGPLLPSAGVAPPPDLAGFLAHWRDAGGVVNLSSFTFAQGPLDLTGNGTLALDANLQPLGSGKVTATGLSDLVDLLAARGAMKHKDAGIAQAVINGLQKPGADGRPQVTIGLNIQDSIVSFGFARLAKLPQIIWP